MKKTGRPPYEPNDSDRSKIKIMAAAGMTAQQIAAVVGVGKNTLYKHYKKELRTAALEATAQVAANLFQMTKKNPAAAIFWMKTRAGWKETGPEGEKAKERPRLVVEEIPMSEHD